MWLQLGIRSSCFPDCVQKCPQHTLGHSISLYGDMRPWLHPHSGPQTWGSLSSPYIGGWAHEGHR